VIEEHSLVNESLSL